jgi:hypothetical protein
MFTRLIQRASVSGALMMAIGLLAITEATHAVPVTIDMTAHGQGVFDQEFFKSQGIIFTEGDFVGFIQGDEALGLVEGASHPGTLRISGLFAPGAVTSISAQIAPGFQGTAVYRLAALDVLSNIIASRSVLVTQDEGDPENSGFGYFTIALSELPGPVGFFVDNTFVRSSFPVNRTTDGGVSSITFNTTVPEPTAITLVGIGLAALGFLRRGKAQL